MIEKERPLNYGDYQILEMLLHIMHQHLEKKEGEKEKNAENSVLIQSSEPGCRG